MTEQPPFDLPEALARVRGRRALLKDLAGIVIAQADGLLYDCEQALHSGDAVKLERAAHTLKSSVGSLCAGPAAELAQHLENAGRNGDFTSAAADLQLLTASIQRLVPALQSFLDEPEPVGE